MRMADEWLMQQHLSQENWIDWQGRRLRELHTHSLFKQARRGADQGQKAGPVEFDFASLRSESQQGVSPSFATVDCIVKNTRHV